QQVCLFDQAQGQVSEVTTQPFGFAIAIDDTADALSTHVAAKILFRLLGRCLGAGTQDEFTTTAILGVKLQNRMAGGARPSKEVEHSITRPDCLCEQLLNQG